MAQMDVVHARFDGLKVTVETTIPDDLAAALSLAKRQAASRNDPVPITYGGVDLQVRKSGGASAFSVSTGDYGAEWYLLDPHNKPKNNPGVTVDFRAFLLATGGVQAARTMFEAHMAALGIRWEAHLVKVSRLDFTVDLLAPGFEPNRRHIVAPAGTRTNERDTTPGEEHGVGDGVSGVKAGHISNRQLAIYDKRREVLDTGKKGWLAIWNARRTPEGKPPLDLADKHASQVWRFEMRMGSRQLRNRWEIRGWDALDARAGDAIAEFAEKVRYCEPSRDTNRSRWPLHPAWRIVQGEAARHFEGRRSYADPVEVREANRAAHIEMLDAQLLGLLISRAAAGGVEAEDAEGFFKRHVGALARLSREHAVGIEDRMARAAGRYVFR
jgi:hypothetical protein